MSVATQQPPGDDFFRQDFARSRRLFQACRRACALTNAVEVLPCPGRAPGGEPLTTDLAWLGPAQAGRVLVLISATHGVEGFAGSAIQCATLSRLRGLPEDTAVLMVHALNPWGFAWLRRCDADGIDLNRNFIDFRQPLPDNPGYRALRSTLQWPRDQRLAALREWQARHGRHALETALSDGQYLDPDAPFFGGFGVARGRHLVEALMRRYRLHRRRLGVIDIHTGLGPWAAGEIICDHAPGSAGTRTANRWYGEQITLPLAGTSSSVPKQGLMDYAWHRIMDDESCFVTLEFGTYSTDALLDVLQEDHRRHREGPVPLPAQAPMRDHFAPADPHWRAAVQARAGTVIDMALRGLAN